jgi:hypothetical protein
MASTANVAQMVRLATVVQRARAVREARRAQQASKENQVTAASVAQMVRKVNAELQASSIPLLWKL